jgi:hypothetical protein
VHGGRDRDSPLIREQCLPEASTSQEHGSKPATSVKNGKLRKSICRIREIDDDADAMLQYEHLDGVSKR